MVAPRTIQFLFGALLLIFIFTLFGHSSRDVLSNGKPRPSSEYQGLTHRISSHIRPFFNSGSSWLSRHLKRSEQIYQAMVSQRAHLAAYYPEGEEKKLFPADSAASSMKTPFSIWDFAPAAFNCPHTMQRVGRLGDGGKWLCGLEKYQRFSAKSFPEDKPSCIIYSFGLQAETSFEEEFLQRAPGCEVWVYDFSASQFGSQLQTVEAAGRAHFLQAEVAGTTDEAKTPPFYSIQDLMQRNGHDHIDVVRMNIEGFEFESMKSLIESFATSSDGEVPVSQLLVEVHLDPGRIKNADEFMGWWVMLEDAGFRPVWAEQNLLVSTIPIHDAKPRYAKYTLINIKDSKSVLLK